MASHECPVVRVKMEPHPNADSLSIVRIGGYQVVVRTADWKDGDLGMYIPPESVVPDVEEFQWLRDTGSSNWQRIRAVRLRGEISLGLLVKAPPGVSEGEDGGPILGITHWNPPDPVDTRGEDEGGPSVYVPVYDVENIRKYPDIIQEGEMVRITEKIHGCNARFLYWDHRMWVGSRTRWKKYDPKNLWWKALEMGFGPLVESFCCQNPGFILYGEVYGHVQDLRYGATSGELWICIFDYLIDGQWFSTFPHRGDLYYKGEPPSEVPELYRGPFSMEKAEELANGDSSIPRANHMREGVVIEPVVPRTHPTIGRGKLKLVSNRYLER